MICMTASIFTMIFYYAGTISAQSELMVEVGLLTIKTFFELFFRKWGTDLLCHHLVMGGAFLLVQLPLFARWAFVCVQMQVVHVPLWLKHAWVISERNQSFKHLDCRHIRAVLHTAFWPVWLTTVCFRTPFLIRSAAAGLPGPAGWIILGFSAAVLYLDVLWTAEVALSKSHGVVGPAITEPEGWPMGIRQVRPWAIAPCWLGLTCAIVPPLTTF